MKYPIFFVALLLMILFSSETQAKWSAPPFSTLDAGPFTENFGYVGFRFARDTILTTAWAIYATPPHPVGEVHGHSDYEFISLIHLEPAPIGEVTRNLVSEYEKVHGPIDGPLIDGAWPQAMEVSFMVREMRDEVKNFGKPFFLTGIIGVEL